MSSLTQSPSSPEMGEGGDATPDVAVVAAPSRRLEIAVATGSAVLAAGMLALTRAIPVAIETGGVDPRWWPSVLTGTWLGLSVAVLAWSLLRPAPERDDLEGTNRQGWQRLALLVVLSAAFVALWPVVGFVPTALVFLALVLWVCGARSWKTLVIYPVATTAFIYFLFDLLLRVPL